MDKGTNQCGRQKLTSSIKTLSALLSLLVSNLSFIIRPASSSLPMDDSAFKVPTRGGTFALRPAVLLGGYVVWISFATVT